MSSVWSQVIQQQHLTYVQQLEVRAISDINLVVIHATETPDLAAARALAEIVHYRGTQTGNSGHFYIDIDGVVYQYVPLARVAHHVRGHNQLSVGIELVNLGRYPHWFRSDYQQWTAQYSQAQLDALLLLLNDLQQKLPQLTYLARHSDLDQEQVAAADCPDILIRRKLDPGAVFPWNWLLTASDLQPYSD